MITLEKAQALAAIYDMEVVDVETKHDCKKHDKIPDYIKLTVVFRGILNNIYVYLSPDYKVVSNKEFYIECKVKNALFAVI